MRNYLEANTEALRRRVARKLRLLLGGGARHPDLQLRALFQHLTSQRAPSGVTAWIRTLAPEVREYLARLRAGVPIDEPDVVALQSAVGGKLLYAACRRAHVFWTNGADTARVERAIAALTDQYDPRIIVVIRQYWRFCLSRRIELRRKRRHGMLDPHLTNDVQSLRIMADFLDSVLQQSAIAALSQEHIDRYLANHPRSHACHIGRFCRWLHAAGIVGSHLRVPLRVANGAEGGGREQFFSVLQSARKSTTLTLPVRCALLLMALCRQNLTVIVALRKQDIWRRGARVHVRFSSGVTWWLKGPEAALLWRLRSQTRDWLFPSQRARGTATSAGNLSLHIHRELDVNLRSLRIEAIRELLQDLDVGEAVRVVGLSRGGAAAWRKRLGVLPVAVRRELARLGRSAAA